jgi:Flp pilus assembly protein CpaB
LLILLGLLIAIGGALAAVAIAGSGGGGGTGTVPGAVATPTPGPSIVVVVASTKIAAGTVVDKSMVKTAPRKVADIAALNGTTFSNASDVIGRIASTDIPQDQVVVSGALLTPGSAVDGQSIKDSIDKGFVAMSVELDQTNGVGTLLVPGDHVDILLTTYVTQLAISIKDAAGTQITTGGTQLTSKLVLQNCKILRTLLPPVESTNSTAASGASPAVAPVASSATVQLTQRHMIAVIEVTAEQSELIRWAQRTEQSNPQTYIDLAFVLRSSADDNTDPMSSNPFTDIPGVTFTEIVKKYGVLPPDPLGTLPKTLGGFINW